MARVRRMRPRVDEDQARVPTHHICHCGKRFRRREHLRRHQATHQPPSFVCPECRRSFTRNDLLQRHAARHTREPSRRSRLACDACRANKTKCSGGIPCSLCAKREIACTYSRSVPSEAGADAGENEAPAVQTSSRTTSSNTTKTPYNSSQAGLINPHCAVSVAPEARTETQQEPQTPGVATAVAGMLLVSAAIETRPRSLRTLLESTSDDVRAWFADCRNAYEKYFHHHWPVIHMVTLHLDRDSLATCVSVVIIGCWLQGHEEAKELAIAAHQRLMDGYFEELTSGASLPDPDKAWQIESYQGIVLNAVFALHSNRKPLITRASLLLGLLIATMRQIGVFSAERAEYQRKTHFPGTFVPYLVLNHQGWIRLATYLFKIDTYMSVLAGHYPTIGPHELDICLSSTYSAYDADGLPKFFARSSLEPGGREGFRLCDVLQDPWLLTPDMFLLEDATMGLCALLPQLWQYRNLVRRRGAADGRSKIRVELLGRLAAWKDRLDSASCLCESGAALGDEATEFPLRAYSGQEGDSSTSALRRARSLMQEATMLHHLLSLHLHADLQGLGQVAPGLRDLEHEHAEDIDSELRLRAREWALSTDGRKAVALAVTILDESSAWEAGRGLPLIETALSAGYIVMRVWAQYSDDGTCNCAPVAGAQARARETFDSGDVVLSGKNTVLGSISVCRCNAQEWERQFRMARLRVGGQPMEET